VLLLSGLLALAMALGVRHRAAAAALFVLYTYSWAMSMLDSYQHHYFMSSVLLCLIFFPTLGASEVHPPVETVQPTATKKQRKRAAQQAERRAPVLVSAFGYNLLAAVIVILYTYTSLAKMDAQWVQGHTIKRISSAEQVAGPLRDLFVGFGMSADTFWSLFATSVIPLELLVAVGYALAGLQDTRRSRWLRTLTLAGFVLAMTLHMGAEALGLEIGWFSYYMMLLGGAYLLPGVVVDWLARVVTWPVQWVSTQLADFTAPGDGESGAQGVAPTLAVAVATALVLGAVGYLLDLPGAIEACALAGLVAVLAAGVAVSRKRAIVARLPLLGTALAGALMWLAIVRSDVRWDFYRYLGGDLRRRAQPEAALEAYERGERYAPPGQSRKDKINELKQQLGR
jgi:Vitamin K-dependent gamma-carboxylase